MKRFSGLLAIALLFSTALIAAEYESNYRVGDTWIYKTTGADKGTAVFKITSKEGEGEKMLWNANYKIGENILKFKIDKDGFTHGMADAGNKWMAIEPPIPGYNSFEGIEVGKTKQFDAKMFPKDKPDVAMNVIVNAERLADESVTVPAGTFENCRHFKFDTKMDLGNDKAGAAMTMNISSKTELWFHPQVNGAVKLIEQQDPVSVGQRKVSAAKVTTSELQQYVRGKE